MTLRADLLAAIRADPRDDAPRHVYADLLVREGDTDRAQLIHLQLRRAALPAWDAEAAAIELLERALLAKHEAAWRADLPAVAGVTWGPFARGFVDTAVVESIAQVAPGIVAAAPIRRVVTRWWHGMTAPPLPALPGVDTLTIVGTVMGAGPVTALVASPLMSTVRTLELVDASLDAGLLPLLECKQLEALRIPRHVVGNRGLKKLLAAALPNLAELDICVGNDEDGYIGSGGRSRTNRVTAKIADELAAWPGLARLRSLDFSGGKLGRAGLETLLASPCTKALTSLAVRAIADAEWEVDDSLAAFAAGPAGALAELDLRDNDIDEDAARALAASPALHDLAVLRIDGVRSRHWDRLAQASWVHALRVLSCGEAALAALIRQRPKNLHALHVVADGNAATDLTKLLAATPLPALRSLDLSRAHVADADLAALGKLTTLPNLAAVILATNMPVFAAGRAVNAKPAFTPAGAAAFATAPLGRRLASLETGIADVDRLPRRATIGVGSLRV